MSVISKNAKTKTLKFVPTLQLGLMTFPAIFTRKTVSLSKILAEIKKS